LENRKFGNRSIPSLFRIFRFTGQISLLVGILLLKKKGKGKHAHTRLNGKIGKQDLGMEGGKETLRARARRVLWRCALWCFFAPFFVFVGFLLYLCGKSDIFLYSINETGNYVAKRSFFYVSLLVIVFFSFFVL
jgi:hypothetical protein